MNKKPEDNVKEYPNSIDTRVALLEQSINSIDRTLIEIKSDIKESLRSIERRFDKIDEKLDKVYSKLDSKIDNRFFWLLGLQITSFVGLLTTIAKAVHWI